MELEQSTESGGSLSEIRPVASDLRLRLIILLFLLTLGVFRFWRSASSVSELEVCPDSVEYVSGAIHLGEGTGYHVVIDGRNFPSQYPPGFSVFLAPVYRLFPGNLGVGIYLVLPFGLLLIFSVFWLGWQLGGLPAAVLGALAVLATPSVSSRVREIMTDTPSTALGLLVLALLVKNRIAPSARLIILAAVAGVLATFLRPLDFCFLFPVFFSVYRMDRSRGRSWVGALCVGLALVPIGYTLFYNKTTFGSFTRDGYKYWIAYRYDYPTVLFSYRNLLRNAVLFESHTFATTAACFVVASVYTAKRKFWSTRPAWSELRISALAGIVPMSCLYVTYWYVEHRFYLPLLCVACIVSAAAAVEFLRRWSPRYAPLAFSGLAAVFTASIIYSRCTVSDDTTNRRAVAAIQQFVPVDALLVRTLDPVYLALTINGDGKRQCIPLSRNVSMGDLVTTTRKVLAHVDEDRSAQELINAGSTPLYEFTAEERPEIIAAALATGRRVFLDLSRKERLGVTTTPLLKKFRTSLVNPDTRLYEVLPNP